MSTCFPQPIHEALWQVEQVAARHIFAVSGGCSIEMKEKCLEEELVDGGWWR